MLHLDHYQLESIIALVSSFKTQLKVESSVDTDLIEYYEVLLLKLNSMYEAAEYAHLSGN